VLDEVVVEYPVGHKRRVSKRACPVGALCASIVSVILFLISVHIVSPAGRRHSSPPRQVRQTYRSTFRYSPAAKVHL
jgi:hypothetical protein